MVFVSIFSSEKNQLQIGKNGKKSEKFFITLFHYHISVMRYTSSSEREPRNIFKKMKYFWQKNEGVILDDGTFVDQISSLCLCCFSRKRKVSVSFISFEKYELRMRKNFSKKFFVLFFAQKHQL